MKLTQEQRRRIKEACSGKSAEAYSRLPAVNMYSKRLDEVLQEIMMESPEAFVAPFGDKKSYSILKKRKFYHEPTSLNVPLEEYIVPAPVKGY